MSSPAGSRAWQLLRAASFDAARDPGDRLDVKPLQAWRARLALRSLQASVVVQLVLAIVKVTLGGAVDQPFVLAGALVNAGATVAKVVILLGTGDDPRQGGHHRHYARAGVVVLVTGLAYTGCCVVAAGAGSFSSYGRGVAILVATSAFVELGAAISGSLTARRFWTPLVQANKLVNLAGGLVALAVTQVAILSFTTEDVGRTLTANVVFSLLAGAGVVTIGIGMLLLGRRQSKHH